MKSEAVNRLFDNMTFANIKLSRVKSPKEQNDFRDQNNRDLPVTVADPMYTGDGTVGFVLSKNGNEMMHSIFSKEKHLNQVLRAAV